MAGWSHRASEAPHRLTRTSEYAQLLRGRRVTSAEFAKVTQNDYNTPSQAGQGSGQELLLAGRRAWYFQLFHVQYTVVLHAILSFDSLTNPHTRSPLTRRPRPCQKRNL